MVGLFKALLSLLLVTLVAADDLQITQPSSNIWWVANSTNVLSWTCNQVSITNFTVLVNSPNTAAPLAIIAIQLTDQCSITVSQAQADQPPGSGYTIIFANPLNSSQPYATSQPFEIKPLGSLYPSQVSSSASAASGTAGTTSSPSATPNTSGALGMYSPSFIGLAGVMGLLAAGILGA